MDEVRLLAVEPLTREAFAPYGEVIEPAATKGTHGINAGTAERFHALARIDVVGPDGHAAISQVRAQPRAFPFLVSMLERHPLGSQAFVPLDPAIRYLVVVAHDPGATPRAFLAEHGQGVNYHRGTWHHPLIALDRVSDFLIVDRVGAGENCEEAALPRQWRIEI